MTQTEIQSAYIALLLGCKFVMDVCVTQVKMSAISAISMIFHMLHCLLDEAVLHVDTASTPSRKLHHMLQFSAASCPRQCQGGHKQVVSCPRQSMTSVCAHLVKTTVSVTTACCHLLIDIGALQGVATIRCHSIWDVKQFVMDTLHYTAQ